MKLDFGSHVRQLEFTPEQCKMLIPLVDVCWQLLEKAYENNLADLNVRKIKWFKQTQEILSAGVELELDVIIEIYIGCYDETKMIKDLLIDVSPYYSSEIKKQYLDMAVEFDKVCQFHYHALVLNSEV